MITGPPDTVKRARKLRSEMSLPEAMLWKELRERPGGYKFRRQHPASSFVLDFFCASVRLAIEVDGWGHDNIRSAEADAARSRHLRSQGVATTRIPAKAILVDVGACVDRVVEICDQRKMQMTDSPRVPLHQPAAGSPPRFGEDR